MFYNFIKPNATLCKNPDKSKTLRTPSMVAEIAELLMTFYKVQLS